MGFVCVPCFVGDNGTVVFLEEVPMQALPMFQGEQRTCVSCLFSSLRGY